MVKWRPVRTASPRLAGMTLPSSVFDGINATVADSFRVRAAWVDDFAASTKWMAGFDMSATLAQSVRLRTDIIDKGALGASFRAGILKDMGLGPSFRAGIFDNLGMGEAFKAKMLGAVTANLAASTRASDLFAGMKLPVVETFRTNFFDGIGATLAESLRVRTDLFDTISKLDFDALLGDLDEWDWLEDDIADIANTDGSRLSRMLHAMTVVDQVFAVYAVLIVLQLLVHAAVDPDTPYNPSLAMVNLLQAHLDNIGPAIVCYVVAKYAESRMSD